MESTRSPRGVTHRSWWSWLVIVVAAMLLLGSPGLPAAMAQDDPETEETPDVVIPGTGADEDPGTAEAVQDDEPAAEETEEPEDEPAGPSSASGLDATGVGSPAVIGQGLAFLTGGRVVWQVRAVEPADPDSAQSRTATTAVAFQVEGSTVIRNDITGKRVLLEPGEAFFLSGGDPYTSMANSDGSLVWLFEVVDDVAVSDDAFYESPMIEDYDEGVYDLEMIRFVLQPGEVADIPDHTGPALVMSIDGDIDIESNGLGLLGTGDGQLVLEAGTVANNSTSPVVYVVVALGDEVDDAPAASSSTATTPEAVDDGDDDGGASEGDAGATDDDAAAPDDTAGSDAGTGSSDYQTSINITALSELYVVVTVDGVTAFDGPIPEGGQSGVIVGSVFVVYTTWGAMTLFTNACGDEFNMGFEEGETTYTLEATANSCPPE